MASNDLTNNEMESVFRPDCVLHHNCLGINEEGLSNIQSERHVLQPVLALEFSRRLDRLFCHLSELQCFKLDQDVNSEERPQESKCLDSEGE